MCKTYIKLGVVAATLLFAFTVSVDSVMGQSCGDQCKDKAVVGCGSSSSCDKATQCSADKTCCSSDKSCCSKEGVALVCPFSQCVVSGKKLAQTQKPVSINHEGRKIYFYDEKARDLFQAKPEAFLGKYDQALVNVQCSSYPLDYCVVTGTKFSEEKKPVNYIYNGRLVRFCCSSLVPQFKENPEKYMVALDKAIVDQQLASYPLDTCVVSGIELGKNGNEPVNHIFSNQLVRLNCNGCVQKFDENPLPYMSTVYAALASASAKESAGKAAQAASSVATPKSECCGSCQGVGKGRTDT